MRRAAVVGFVIILKQVLARGGVDERLEDNSGV